MLARLCCTLSLTLLATAYTLPGAKGAAKPGSAATHHKPIETHHSLSRPFDSSSVYWQFGGATVLTDKLVRLTPATQSRSGWLWNDYPLTSTDWEVELEFKCGPDANIGGDGFALWALDGSFDMTNQNLLNGPLFGASERFKGFGIIFDTYDNDAKRDNPTVFVLQNDGERFQYNHDNDFENDMVRDETYKCTSDIRNSQRPVKALIRFLDNTVHVYMDTSEAKKAPPKNSRYASRRRSKEDNYKFCLSVNLGDKVNGTLHLALTALTGQVADVHDIYAITTRYLDDTDAIIDDAMLERVDGYVAGNISTWSSIYWFFIVASGFALLGETVYEILSLTTWRSSQINPVYLCEKLNVLITPHYTVQLAMTALFLVTMNWFPLLLNFPLAAYRIYLMSQRKHRLEPSQFDAGGGGSYVNMLYVSAILYAVLDIYYLSVFSSVA